MTITNGRNTLLCMSLMDSIKSTKQNAMESKTLYVCVTWLSQLGNIKIYSTGQRKLQKYKKMTQFRNMGKNPIIKDIIFQEENNVN